MEGHTGGDPCGTAAKDGARALRVDAVVFTLQK